MLQILGILWLAPFVIFGTAVFASIRISKRRWIIHSFAVLPLPLAFPIHFMIGASMLDSDPNAGELFAAGMVFLLYLFFAVLATIGYGIFVWRTRGRLRISAS